MDVKLNNKTNFGALKTSPHLADKLGTKIGANFSRFNEGIGLGLHRLMPYGHFEKLVTQYPDVFISNKEYGEILKHERPYKKALEIAQCATELTAEKVRKAFLMAEVFKKRPPFHGERTILLKELNLEDKV